MRGYVYYLDYPVRVDSVFGAWRFEELLDKYADEPDKIHAQLQKENISHLLIHLKAFLADGNADLTTGRTKKLQQTFMTLLQKRFIVPVEKYSHPVRVPQKAKVLDIQIQNNRPIVILEFIDTQQKVQITQLDNLTQINIGQVLEANSIIGTEATVMTYSVSSENSFLPAPVKPQ